MMTEMPSVKTHPVLMTMFVVVFSLGLFIAGNFSGWFLRVMSESRAELSVVVDDGEFMQALEVKTQEWTSEYNAWSESFHIDHPETPDCLAKPLPSYYHENDYTQRINNEDNI